MSVDSRCRCSESQMSCLIASIELEFLATTGQATASRLPDKCDCLRAMLEEVATERQPKVFVLA